MKESVSDLTKFLTDTTVNGLCSIKLVICSRYGVESEIYKGLLQRQTLRNVDLANIYSKDEDIKIYIKSKIQGIKQKHAKLDDNWLNDAKLVEMAEKAKGLFI